MDELNAMVGITRSKVIAEFGRHNKFTNSGWCQAMGWYPVLEEFYMVACSNTHSNHLISSDKFWHHISLHKVLPGTPYYFVLQSLHKVLPSTTSYYKACTKYFPSTTSYYKACRKHFPVLLRTTKLAQSLHKALPSTTSYYKACTKYFPVLLRTTSLHKILPSTTLH